MKGLTILRCGLGRDSLAMLLLLLEGELVADGLRLAPADVHAVVFTDTGEEWPSTYALVKPVRAMCEGAGVRFLAQWKPSAARMARYMAACIEAGKLVDDRDWRATEPATVEEKCRVGWYHLRGRLMWDYMSRGMVVPFRDGGCTENHKVLPMRRMLADLARERWVSLAGDRTPGKNPNATWSRWVKAGVATPHTMLIGIAADEAHRALTGVGPGYERSVYPLVEMGVTKADEAAILARHGLGHVHKSGCMMCKFQPIGWYWALSELRPREFAAVVAYEAHALDNGRVKGNGQYLFPKTRGPDGKPLRIRAAVEQWRSNNPHATVEAVMRKDYKRCDVGGVPQKEPS